MSVVATWAGALTPPGAEHLVGAGTTRAGRACMFAELEAARAMPRRTGQPPGPINPALYALAAAHALAAVPVSELKVCTATPKDDESYNLPRSSASPRDCPAAGQGKQGAAELVPELARAAVRPDCPGWRGPGQGPGQPEQGPGQAAKGPVQAEHDLSGAAEPLFWG